MRIGLSLLAVFLLTACPESPPPEVAIAKVQDPAPDAEAPKAQEPNASSASGATSAEAEALDVPLTGGPGDPAQGKFTLAQATAGMPAGTAPLTATIRTSIGTMKCTLDADHAPISVANFVGLARGKRPWKTDSGEWVKRPAYDGTSFHRIIKGFMIQGGDPTGTGTGEPGYTIPDEAWAGATHDRAGLLCMANRGPNTNGMQFFITDASTPHLDRGRTAYTIFGSCAPLSVVHAIAAVPVGVADRPTTPVTIDAITIDR